MSWSKEDLLKSFCKPPSEAGVKTWWHWMNGNVSSKGITLDLEAMNRVGVAGFQIFQVGTGIPKGTVQFGSPEHLDLLKHAIKEAERLGLEFVMHNCSGWSSSGGPWITPEYSMKRLVWSEIFITGGKPVEINLPKPYANLDYYEDAFVIAFPSLPGEERPYKESVCNVMSNNGPVEIDVLTDYNPSTGIEIHPATSDQSPYIQFEFCRPFEARSISISYTPISTRPFFSRVPITVTLEISDDGTNFNKVIESKSFISGFGSRMEEIMTKNFPVVCAKYFRLVFSEPIKLSEVYIFRNARVSNLLSKIGLSASSPFGVENSTLDVTKEDPIGSAINPETIINLTELMDKSGRLSWNAPAGEWTILRIGYTTMGTKNHPAAEGGEGLECDKYSKEAMEYHLNKFFEKLLPSLEPLASKGMAGVLIDSYEVGFQNWTKNLPQEFKSRRGYDLVRYLPAMTGRIVGSAEITERFLWDMRRTFADLMADYYYGGLTEFCHKYGLKSYTEPYAFGSGAGIESNAPFDEIQIGSRVDVPMGEFWVARDDSHERSVKMAASVAHIYGKQIVGAESFTGEPSASSWQEHPYLMKSLGDFMFTRGLNQIIFHTYAHQPHPTVKPGMTMGPFGCMFNRNNTWWEQGRKWLEYLSRCQYMLQQGSFVGDILYFVGEDPRSSAPHESRLNPPLPNGYDYDFVDAEAILSRLDVKDGKIVTPEGLSYRVLVFGDRKKVTLKLLRKIKDMVEKGMCLVVNSKPDSSPSLSDYQNDEELKQIINELWGDLDGKSVKERYFGKGKIFWGMSLEDVLEKLNIKPDFEFTSKSSDALINYIHRRIGNDMDIYFIANRRRRPESLVCTFRVDGKQPEFWNPETGEVIPFPIYEVLEDGRIRLPLHLGPSGSMFVVFHSPASDNRFTSLERNGKVILGTKPFSKVSPGLHPNVMNNFTISVWVKPEVNASLPFSAMLPNISGACWIFYPPEGETIYGEGHAICGLVSGRNGIAVYERSKGNPIPVLIIQMPLEGWTHIALIYEDGAPSLFVNGKFVCRGSRSNKLVHPGVGELYLNDTVTTQPAYTIGDTNDPEVFNRVLNFIDIRRIFDAGPPKLEEHLPVEITSKETVELLFWKGGNYVLRGPNGYVEFQIPEIDLSMEIKGPWRVSFPPDMGAPEEIVLTQLISLHRHQDDGVKYFSGTATYRAQFTLQADFISEDKRIYLDLGRVENIAEVKVNGKDLGIMWKPPYLLDITDVVKVGDNDLEVQVTNVWVNRLIGDEQLPAEYDYGGGMGFMGGAIKELPEWYKKGLPKPIGKRVTFTTWHLYDKDSPLVESGLIGPVMLRVVFRKVISD